jgi:hypothetical protein
LSYSKESSSNNYSNGGASDQYAAFSLGDVGRNTVADTVEDFYSSGSTATTTNTKLWQLTFANDSAGGSNAGGKFEGLNRSSCIPNYWAKKPTNNANITTLSPNQPAAPGNLSAGTAYAATPASGTNFSLNGSSNTTPWVIPVGAQIVIYVDGNVYIGSNITYNPGYQVDTVPKFALVVRGSIYIDKSVTQLDGLYIAQPANPANITTDDGDIWTCHTNDQNIVYYTDPSICNTKLNVNGALIAKQVNLLRTYGDVSTAPLPNAATSEDKLANGLGATSRAAETINYSPAMVMGGPFFNPPSTGALPIDSEVSLPPVF